VQVGKLLPQVAVQSRLCVIKYFIVHAVKKTDIFDCQFQNHNRCSDYILNVF